MYERLLDLLRCPTCGRSLEPEVLGMKTGEGPTEITEALLHCDQDHWFPVVGNIPRMLPDSMQDHLLQLRPLLESRPPRLRAVVDEVVRTDGAGTAYDKRTRQNFSNEWAHFELGDATWGIDLDARVRGFFVEPLGIPLEELSRSTVLDAGCGNGTQSVAYGSLGMEVVAMDISSGLTHGERFRQSRASAGGDRVHFVQADLQSPPVAAHSVDIIHSAGVLHHTPNTEDTFRTLCSRLRPGGTFYVWLYSYEPVVTPVVNSLRALSTRLPPPVFAGLAEVLAEPFRAFCVGLNALGIRKYGRLSHREAVLSLLDIFGAPHAHHHSYPEVARWYEDEGFEKVWPCNPSRRGFGVCGRLGREGVIAV